MKKLLLTLWVTALFFSGCAKKETGCMPVSPQSEESQLTSYAVANNIDAVKHVSGIYYQVTDGGTGVAPTANSTVTAAYTGKLLNGTIFDSRTASFSLSGVIEGWQIGIPLIKKGGKIKLIIPSSYAYGCNGSPGAGIPPNSVLFFDISLIDVK
jgi:FKBP-type peptidyl-prolyl cis-trans isomerase FkpA